MRMAARRALEYGIWIKMFEGLAVFIDMRYQTCFMQFCLGACALWVRWHVCDCVIYVGMRVNLCVLCVHVHVCVCGPSLYN